MDMVKVEKVVTGKDLREFIRFPWEVYRGDSNWVPPLMADMKEKLDPARNPFFEHAELELFLARRDGRVAGRIAAILDRDHNSFHNETTAFFGLYESLDDPQVAAALLETAGAWGKSRGMTVLRGPMNLSMNDECAFLLEGFDSPPALMMPYNPPYYLDLMAKAGLTKAKDLYAYIMSRDHETAARVASVVERAKKEFPAVLRTVDLKNVAAEAEKISFIYNNGWTKNWGFVPWTANEMKHMVAKLKTLADPDLVIFAEIEGKPVGFAFGLPNYNEVLRKMNGRLFPVGWLIFLLHKKRIKSMRALVFGLVKDYHHSGLSYLLYSEFERNAIRKGYQWGELSWQLEDNDAVNHFAASIGAKVYKKYRIFQKPIA